MSGSIAITNLQLSFYDGKVKKHILNIPKLLINSGEQLCIAGASGSGKTSLLKVISGLYLPDTGTVCHEKQDITQLSEYARDRWRAQNIGFIFQDFKLFPQLTALENVLIATGFYSFTPAHGLHERALSLLITMGIQDITQPVKTMSRGEQQRVAIARALLFKPKIILADEPTASLDLENAEIVFELLLHKAKEDQSSLIIVSHDPLVKNRMQLLGLERGGILRGMQ